MISWMFVILQLKASGLEVIESQLLLYCVVCIFVISLCYLG